MGDPKSYLTVEIMEINLKKKGKKKILYYNCLTPFLLLQLTDVITNILGATLGVTLFHFYPHRSIQTFFKV